MREAAPKSRISGGDQGAQASTISDNHPRKTVCFFANIGTGHLNPMLVLAERLAALGWTVLFYAPANARQRVSDTGAIWRHYGCEEWNLFAAAREATVNLLSLPADILLDMSIVSAGLPAALVMLPHLLNEIQTHRPLFTVHDAAAPWGALAGRIAGLPTVCSMSAFPMVMDEVAESYPSGPIQKAAAQYLLEHYGIHYDPLSSYINYSGFNLVFTARFWAESHFKCGASYHFCGPVPFQHSPEDPDHPSIGIARAARDAGKKVVYASFGTVVNGTLRTYYEKVIDRIFAEIIAALGERDDVRLILSAGRKPAAGSDPKMIVNMDCASWFEYVPQPLLLRHTDVFLTHAGMNSTNEGAWHGVPVICCPFFGDGVLNARRFAELKAGVTVDYRIASPMQCAAGSPPMAIGHRPSPSMRSALNAVLDHLPAYRRVAAALGDRFRQQMELEKNIRAMLEWVKSRPRA